MTVSGAKKTICAMKDKTQMEIHGSGRSGGLGFAGWHPSKGGAQASTSNAGQRFKGCGVLCRDEALALPVVDGLLGDAQ